MLKDPKLMMSNEALYQDGVVADVAGPQRAVDAPQKLKGDDK